MSYLNQWVKGKIESLSSSHVTKSTPTLLFLLLLFFTASQFGLHFWPDFSFIDGLRIDYLSPTLYFSDLIFILLLITSLSKLKTVILQKKAKVVIVFLAILLLRVLFQDSPLLGITTFLRVAQLVILVWLSKHFFSEVILHKRIAYTLAIALLLMSLLTLLQWLHQGSVGGLWYFLGERTFSGSTPGIANASLLGNLVLRPYATFPHPNVLGGFLLVYLLLMISFIKRQVVGRYEFLFISFTILFSTAALLMTLSRSAVIVGVLAFIFLFISSRHKKRSLATLLLLVIVVLAIFLSSPLLVSRFMYFSSGDTSFSTRIMLSVQALKLFQDNMIVGVGLGEFLSSLQRTFSPPFSYLQPVHNGLLLFIVETGLLGLVMIGFFLLHLVKTVLKTTLFKREKLAMFGVLVLLCSVDHYLYSLQQGRLLLGFLIGFLLIEKPRFHFDKAKITDTHIDELA